MAGFPPASAKKGNVRVPNGNPTQMNSTPTSTGPHDLKSSIAMKDKANVAQPVAEKTTFLF